MLGKCDFFSITFNSIQSDFFMDIDKIKFCFLVGILSFSCKIQLGSDRYNANRTGNVYKLQLNPSGDAKYYYNISNESSVKMEVEDKEVDDITKAKVGVEYSVKKDSTGNFLVTIQYDKMHVYLKSGEKESDMDAANAASSIDPVEKMLGIIKDATLTASVNSSGDVKNISGYKELSANLLASFPQSDANTRVIIQSRLNQMIQQNIIKKNLDQVFRMFPDSAIHIGDRWKIYSKEKEEFSINVASFFTLKEINDGIAVISFESELTSDSSISTIMGYDATVSLTGKQEGEFNVDIKSGLPVKNEMNGKVEGTVHFQGREIPIKIESSIKMDGKKVN
jgi:hypothetical protein